MKEQIGIVVHGQYFRVCAAWYSDRRTPDTRRSWTYALSTRPSYARNRARVRSGGFSLYLRALFGGQDR